MNKNDPELVKIAEAARFLGVHRRTVYRRIWSGELPASKVGGLYLIRRADLDALLEKGRTTAPKKEHQTAKALKCSACFRGLEDDTHIADLCQAEGCDALICNRCWSAGERHCVRHTPDRDQKWERARQARQRGELSTLVKGGRARLQEINYLNRIQARVDKINTLIHPLSEEVLTISDWESCQETGDERAQVMNLLGKMMLDQDTTKKVPLNTWVRWDLPTNKRQKGLPLRIQAQVVSRISAMLRDGFDTQPLGEDELAEHLTRLGQETEADGVVTLVTLAATTGWSEATRAAIRGDSPGSAFAHHHMLVYCFDLQTGELIYNPQDERLRGYVELFAPVLPAEILEEVIEAVEAELLTHESLSLQHAIEVLPYRQEQLEKAFERMASGGAYVLTEVPELGPAIVRA